MIVYFERTGGFTAIPLRVRIDVESMEPQEKDQMHMLVESAKFFELPGQVQSEGAGSDRFQYKLTIEEKGQSHTVECGESSSPEKLQPLIQHLTQMARTRRTG